MANRDQREASRPVHRLSHQSNGYETCVRIEPDENPGRISVQTLDGHIRMHAGDRTFDLVKGKVLVLDHAVPHDVEAIADSAFLLTVAQPEGISS